MKIQILSDLHLEFYMDMGQEILSSLDPSGVDALIVAGDLTTSGHHDLALSTLADLYPEVIFVLGNHDYYNCLNKEEVHEDINNICSRNKNLHWLHNTSVTIQGQRFLGTPMWFREDPMNPIYQKHLNDFTLIPGLQAWVYEENKKATHFLETTVYTEDIVITHHLPSMSAVSDRFRGGPLNRFFVCEMDRLIQVQSPKLWVFGHTHDVQTYLFGETFMACNPKGYPFEVQKDFDPKLVFDTDSRVFS